MPNTRTKLEIKKFISRRGAKALKKCCQDRFYVLLPLGTWGISSEKEID
jgi:hypothetical protein